LFCRGCGNNDHHTASCPTVPGLTKDANGRYPTVCFRCHKVGHIVKVCPLLDSPGNSGETSQN
jgi:hypothetical protein